jgi:hypothetical protein
MNYYLEEFVKTYSCIKHAKLSQLYIDNIFVNTNKVGYTYNKLFDMLFVTRNTKICIEIKTPLKSDLCVTCCVSLFTKNNFYITCKNSYL